MHTYNVDTRTNTIHKHVDITIHTGEQEKHVNRDMIRMIGTHKHMKEHCGARLREVQGEGQGARKRERGLEKYLD
jgi:hypothetical protein